MIKDERRHLIRDLLAQSDGFAGDDERRLVGALVEELFALVDALEAVAAAAAAGR